LGAISDVWFVLGGRGVTVTVLLPRYLHVRKPEPRPIFLLLSHFSG
jgi:hypothetical protein